MQQVQKYLSLKTGKANKIGQLSKGVIHYRILTDQTHQALYFIITGNEEEGYYSKEVVPFEKVEQCVEGIKANAPIASKLFKKAFLGQSNNNAAFLAAILRTEKLIAPVTDAVRKHALQSGWSAWKTDMLKNANKAKPFEPELPKSKATKLEPEPKQPKSKTAKPKSEPEPEPESELESDLELEPEVQP